MTTKTFREGMFLLRDCYRNFILPDEREGKTWLEILGLDISDEEFIPLIKQYCRTEPVPTCPADLINFKLKQ